MKQHEIKIADAVNECFDNTCYTEMDLSAMKDYAIKLFNKLDDLNLSQHLIEGEQQSILIRIIDYKFGHNDMKVYYKDFETYRSLKDIFLKWKDEDKDFRYTTDGHGTSFVFPYNNRNETEDIFSKVKFIL